jgi:hypothetical protein
MKRLLCLPLLLLCFGCARNHFNIPADSFANKVKVLGVAPIIVDTDSIAGYPQKDQLIGLVTDLNRKYEQQLVHKIKGTGNFYTVALLDGDPGQLFANLLFRREKRDDAAIQYNKYFWKNDELRDYIRKNNLDAVMLIVVSGLTKGDKIFSANLLTSMTGDYDFLIMTAQILDPSGTVLWEYPNFRRHILTYDPMINLQYPDFSEAEANLSSGANVKFKTIEGVKRTLEQKRKDLMLRETQESEVYGKQFDAMLSFLKFDPDSEKKVTPPATEKPQIRAEQPKQVEQPPRTPEPKPLPAATPATVAPPAPSAETPQNPLAVPAQTTAPATSAPASRADEIVPAKVGTP